MSIRKAVGTRSAVKPETSHASRAGKLINPGKVVFDDAEMLRQRASMLNPMGAISQELARLAESSPAAGRPVTAWTVTRNTEPESLVDADLVRQRAAQLSPMAQISELLAGN